MKNNTKLLTENNEDCKPYYNRIINEDYIEFTPISISKTKEETALKNKKEYNDDDNNNLSRHKIFNNKNGIQNPKNLDSNYILNTSNLSHEYKLIHSKINNGNDRLGLNNNFIFINKSDKDKDKDKDKDNKNT